MPERFWEKVDRSGGPDACWLWCASLRQGYGQFAIAHGQITTAHRAVWFITHGSFPAAGLYIRHLCESRYAVGDLTVRRCVNPTHLDAGTPSENVADAHAAGRTPIGQRHGGARLSNEDVTAIHRALAEFKRGLAEKYAVSPKTIADIAAGRRWAHLAPTEGTDRHADR